MIFFSFTWTPATGAPSLRKVPQFHKTPTALSVQSIVLFPPLYQLLLHLLLLPHSPPPGLSVSSVLSFRPSFPFSSLFSFSKGCASPLIASSFYLIQQLTSEQTFPWAPDLYIWLFTRILYLNALRHFELSMSKMTLTLFPYGTGVFLVFFLCEFHCHPPSCASEKPRHHLQQLTPLGSHTIPTWGPVDCASQVPLKYIPSCPSLPPLL